MLQKKLYAVLWMTLLIAGLTGCGGGNVQVSASGAQLTAISVSPTDPSIAQNTSQQLTATGVYSDGTTKDLTAYVTWSSADTSVVTITNGTGASFVTNLLASSTSNPGHAYAKAVGKTTVQATSGSASGSTTITVTQATLLSIAVTPTNSNIVAGAALQFMATGTFSDSTTQDLTTQVTWASSNTSIATISTLGLAASIAAGTTTITAISGSISGTAALTVTAGTAGSATLSWNAPTTNTDGTPIANLAGYKIYYGTSSKTYTKIINVGNVTTYVIKNLAPGTYYFATTAYDALGNESDYSNEASRSIQ